MSDEIRVDPPWGDYETLTAAEIIERAEEADDELKFQVVEYETSRQRPRKTILEAFAVTTIEAPSEESTEDDEETGENGGPPPGSPAATGDWVTPTP